MCAYLPIHTRLPLPATAASVCIPETYPDIVNTRESKLHLAFIWRGIYLNFSDGCCASPVWLLWSSPCYHHMSVVTTGPRGLWRLVMSAQRKQEIICVKNIFNDSKLSMDRATPPTLTLPVDI